MKIAYGYRFHGNKAIILFHVSTLSVVSAICKTMLKTLNSNFLECFTHLKLNVIVLFQTEACNDMQIEFFDQVVAWHPEQQQAPDAIIRVKGKS